MYMYFLNKIHSAKCPNGNVRTSLKFLIMPVLCLTCWVKGFTNLT